MSVLVAIGGGELRQKTTAAIDAYVARLAAERAAPERGYALFVGTASHDSLPYFNTFRKTYTSDYNLKADVAVITKDMMSYEKISDKFQKADMIYVGGGDTLFMLDKWRETGVDKLILDAYRRGVIICGLSAGAICWFEKMYSDSVKEDAGTDSPYALYDGLGVVGGLVTPHFNLREKDFCDAMIKGGYTSAYAIEDNAALVFNDGRPARSLSSGGRAWLITQNNGRIEKTPL